MPRVDERKSRWVPLIALPGVALFFALVMAALVPEHLGARVAPAVPGGPASAHSAPAGPRLLSSAEQRSEPPPRVVAARPAPSFGRRGFSPRLERDEPVPELEQPPPGVSGAIRHQGQPRRAVSAPAAIMVAGSGTAAVASSPAPTADDVRGR
jgi:hypothetical protein